MRVLIHAPWPAEYVAELAAALGARDEISRLCLVVRSDFAYADAAGCAVARCYPAARIKRGRWQRLAAHAVALTRTAACIWRERPDVFHVQALHQPLLDWPLLVIARLRGARLVWTAHNSLPHESGRFDAALFRRIYRHVDAVVAHTRFTADTLVRELGVGDAKVRVIAHGPLTLGAAVAPAREEARRALGVTGQTFLLLLFGRLRPYKGLDLLLAALDKLGDPDMHLIVAGEDAFGDAEGQLHGRRDATADLRRVDDEATAAYFAAADLVVLPYRRIDQSGVLMLALTYHCAVLASDLGGLAETIDDERTGFLLDPVDEDALAARLADIKSRPEAIAEIRRNIAADENGERGWPHIAARTADVYRTTIERTGARPTPDTSR